VTNSCRAALKIFAAALIAVCLSIVGSAQQVGDNINVLPVAGADPIRGDAYLQRQVEPALAVSTRNPQHMMAFFNDYRAVDVPGDIGIGESVARRFWRAAQAVLARAIGKAVPREREMPEEAAAAEAWIGMSRSYDGGLTWSGSFLPGFKLDSSPASLSSPVFGFDAASDPVVAAGPCGLIYAGFVAFNRGGSSAIAVARFEDRNDSEHGETFVYQGTTIVESANNATNGYFLDKPALAVDIVRGATGCAHSVYLTYSTFNGLTKDGKFQSQVHMAISRDGGKSFSNDKINGNFNENQGTSIAIDPQSGDLNVFWRHFFSPDTIVQTQLSASTGRWSKPVAIVSDTLQTFDQPTFGSTDLQDPYNGVTFRSNAFPASAVARDGTILVAWQERVDPLTGLPAAGGTPRIVMTARGSKPSWSARKAVDNATRTAEPDGLGYFFNVGRSDTNAHPQVMPSLTCVAGYCLLTYYESRSAALTVGANPGWIGGYSRLLDLRGALIDSNLTIARSFQVSRYPYKVGHSGETQADIDEAAPGIPRLHFANYPTSGGGTKPFIGDYTALIPSVAFVPDGAGGWRWPTADGDLPYPGFRAAWSDNRNLVPPPGGILDFPNYAPPGAAGCGPNFGSRNTDVLTSSISLGLLVTAPTTTKTAPTPPDVLIDFPMTVWNNTGQQRQFKLTIDQNATFASFSKTDPIPVTTGVVTIYPYSSVTKVVYVSNTLQTHVAVVETTSSAGLGLSGGMTFNGAWANPTPSPSLVAPTLAVSDPANPIPQIPIPQNPIPLYPIPQNPIPQNYGITDTTWTVTATGDPTKAYLALLNVDKAYAQDYAFQLIITKPSTISSCASATAVNLTQGSLIANVWDPSNPIPQNPIPQNPIPQNSGFPDSVLAQNSTFTVSPADQQAATLMAAAATVACPDVSGNYRLDVCTGAAPRPADVINITLRAYQKTQTPARLWTPDTLPPSLTISDYWCDGTTAGATNCAIYKKGPDLVVPASLTASQASVVPGGQLMFPASTVSVTNSGTLPADSRRYGFYLSSRSTLALLPNGTVDLTQAVLLGTLLQTASLPAGSAEQVPSQSLTIPSGTAAGAYYLFLYADDQRIVSELSEDNNIGMAGPIMVVTPPDLAVAASVPAPASPISAGSTLMFPSVTVTNVGGSAPGAWRYAYYMSGTSTLDLNAAVLLGSPFDGPSSLAAGSAFPIPQHALTIPMTLPVDPTTGLGSYYVFLVVDSDQAITELSEANNTTSMGPVVVSKRADLVVPSSLAVEPTAVNAGATVQFPYGGVQITNSGNAPAGARTYGIYYSQNTQFDGTAMLLQTLSFPTMLAPAAWDWIAQQTLTIPAGIQRDPTTGIGNYYLYLFADNQNVVIESNEANNIGRSAQISVYGPAYGFLGLQTPCSGPTCTGNAGSSNPLAWQFTLAGVAIASANARPEIWIYRSSCTAWTAGTLLSDGTPEDPGSSSWQYEPSGRPAFTWQFNWKDPKAKAGCYLVYFGSRATGQTVPNGTAFGPIRFTLK
jgi:hypothetical protein